MDKEHKLAEIAVSALSELGKLHNVFVGALSKNQRAENYGEIKVDGDVVTAVVLGQTLTVVVRPVGNSEGLQAMEYTFLARMAKREIPVFHTYLSGHGTLYLNPELTDGLCGIDNKYVSRFLLTKLAAALLGSRVFAPLAYDEALK